MVAVVSTIPGLARFLPDNVVVADVGCRWGFAPHWDAFVPHVLLIGFDADEEEIRRLETAHASDTHMQFVAQALGAEPSRSTLYLTRERGGSSLFKPDRSHLEHLPDWEGRLIDDAAEVSITTFDSWAEEAGVERVDAMKLDTQGSELAILRGAQRSLEDVRHVEVEVCFNELSEGAPLFGEIDSYLREQGFALWRLRDLVCHALDVARDAPRTKEYFWYESTPQPLSMPGGQLIWCNAHYVQRDMYEPHRSAAWTSRLRDACIAEAYGFHDLAMLCLRRLLDEDCPLEVRENVQSVLRSMSASTPKDDSPDRRRQRVAAAARSRIARVAAIVERRRLARGGGHG